MPWTCCGASALLDNRQACPACGLTKAAWTVKFRKTNVFRIGRGAYVEVELVDDLGEPVAGQRFVVRTPDGGGVPGQLDDQGYARVDLGRIGSGAVCTVMFLDLDFERPAWSQEPAPPPEVALAAPRGWVEVELVDSDGRPVGHEPFVVVLPDGGERRGTLDATGFARVGELPEGTVVVRFPERDFAAPAVVEAPPLEAPALEVARGWVEVELVDSDGRPAAHEPFVVVLADGTERPGVLDAAGQARVGELPEGTVVVRFPERDFAAPAAVEAPPLEAPALEVARGWVEVELVDSDGRPVAHEPFVVVLADGAERRGVLDAAGRARVGELPAGTVVVRFPERDFAAPAAVEAPPLEAPAALEVARGWLELELVDSDGRPLGHEPFVVVLPDGRERRGTLDEAGRARLGELPEGRVTVRFPQRDFAAPAATAAPPPALAELVLA